MDQHEDTVFFVEPPQLRDAEPAGQPLVHHLLLFGHLSSTGIVKGWNSMATSPPDRRAVLDQVRAKKPALP